MSAPCWISVEGINGVGKTYLTRRVADRLGSRCVHLAELTDHQPDQLPGRIITAMTGAGGTFLRTGHPLTETLALIALKVRDYEHVQCVPDPRVDLVLEDRGIDTVAMYQAAILAGPAASIPQTLDVAHQVDRTAAAWRPPPHRTVLLTDDLDTCLRRFAARIGEPVCPPDQALITQVHQLYLARVAANPGRFVVIDRAGRTEAQVVDDLENQCRALMETSCPG